jgi:pyridoxine 5-phosphate synthase
MLKELVPTELNLEMAATKEMIDIATKLKPDLVTLVPEKRQELTTEGGLDVKLQRKVIMNAIKKIHNAKIPVSLFINPDTDYITLSKQIGADMVEIHTGMYADAKGKRQEKELIRVINAVKHTLDIDLTVNAGHGLNYFNVTRIAAIPGIRGLYIGHSIVSRAVLVGMERAVRGIKKLIQEALPY